VAGLFQREPIVLVHGLFGSLSDPTITGAFGGATAYTPDLIGYGTLRELNTSELTLDDQAKRVAEFISKQVGTKVHLVGHSVGGAVSALVAMRHPELVASFTSVEGNFTLKDAFWSGQIAEKPVAEVEAIVADLMANPDDWIAGAGVPLNEWTSALARQWLANQPASTIKAQARAVVAATGKDAYLEGMRRLMASGMPVFLIAGARSSDGWDTPLWANQMCSMRINIPNAGHLMMAEDPHAFAKAVLACVGSGMGTAPLRGE